MTTRTKQPWKHNHKTTHLTTKTVQRPALPLESVDDIHGRNSLTTGVFGVGNSITYHILKEYLEDTASFFIDQTANPLYATPASQAPNRRLGDSLNVITQHLSVPFGSSLAQPLTSLAAA
uniref:Histone H4 n=1 Tax=Rhizophora mucronata TaxID=61149 RepID=A0A2P2Q315_RHIMU